MEYSVRTSIFSCAAACLLIGVTGCSSNTTDDESSTTTTERATTTSAAATVTTQLNDIEHQPAEGEYQGALADVTDSACARSEGGWTATGTVTNSTDKPASYRIYVSLLTAEDVTKGVVEVQVDALEAGKSMDYTKDIALDAEDLHCVLRVERRPAA